MQKLVLLAVLLTQISCSGQNQHKNDNKTTMTDTTQKVTRTEEEWKKILTPEQYYVLREKEPTLLSRENII